MTDVVERNVWMFTPTAARVRWLGGDVIEAEKARRRPEVVSTDCDMVYVERWLADGSVECSWTVAPAREDDA